MSALQSLNKDHPAYSRLFCILKLNYMYTTNQLQISQLAQVKMRE